MLDNEIEKGDIVRLADPYQHNLESKNWALYAKLEFNEDYIVSEVEPTGGINYIRLEGKSYIHPASKFTIVRKHMENTNKAPKRAQGFSISGKVHQIKSLWEDLKEIGYKTKEGIFSLERIPLHSNSICVNRPNTEEIEIFKELVAVDSLTEGRKVFNLPEDYAKVLEFAKEQLKDELWKKQLVKIGLGSKKDRVEVEGENILFNNSIYFKKQDITRLYEYLSHIPPMGEYSTYIVDTKSPILRIGCSGEDHRFSLEDIISVLEVLK